MTYETGATPGTDRDTDNGEFDDVEWELCSSAREAAVGLVSPVDGRSLRSLLGLRAFPWDGSPARR